MFDRVSTVILAAGKGTRMKSELPKVLHKLADIPLTAHPIETALQLAPKEIVLVIGHRAELVKKVLSSRFSKASIPIKYALQSRQLGTAHAVMSAVPELSEETDSLLLLYGDVPLLERKTLQSLAEKHFSAGAKVSFLSFIPPDPTGYGRVLRDERGRPIAIREDKDCSPEEKKIRECNSGIYLFDRKFLLRHLEKVENKNRQGEFYLTDIVELAHRDGETVLAEIVEDYFQVSGVNDRSQLAQLEEVWLQKRRLQLMKSGVTLRMPETIFIGYDVTIGGDTVVEPFCCLCGETEIGEKCQIGAFSYLRDAKIPADTELPPYTKISKETK